MSGDTTPAVLIVDDQPNVVKAYALYLEDDYVVRTATGGEAALELLDEEIDVVLLDRRMPDLSGDQVLERIGSQGYTCKVAMVTAVDPDFDILDMAFDAYLTKPVDRDELTQTIDRLIRLTSFTERSQKQCTLAQKRAVLETTKSERELRASDEYAALCQRLEELDTELEGTTDEMDADAFAAAFRDLDT